MPQVTIYLDEEHEKRLRNAAGDAGIPVSRWVASLIEEHTRTVWPAAVREAAGAWPDAPEVELVRGSTPEDLPREPL